LAGIKIVLYWQASLVQPPKGIPESGSAKSKKRFSKISEIVENPMYTARLR
jgi:hypothetical protein